MHKRVIILFCLAGTLISSCKFIKIEISDKRNPTPRILLLNKHIEVSPTGITRISKSDFFLSGFRIKENGMLIYIDSLASDKTDSYQLYDIWGQRKIEDAETFIFEIPADDVVFIRYKPY
jgi:hypothetical protein